MKFCIGKTVVNDLKKYLSKVIIYRKDRTLNCWYSWTPNSMSDVYSQTINLSNYAIGYPDNSDYFEITEGWIKLN